jgi:hypothetical protein
MASMHTLVAGTALAAGALLWAGATSATTVNLATGLNSSGVVYASGNQPDANWTVTNAVNPENAPIAYTVFPDNADWYGGWFADGPNSDWIAANPNDAYGNGNMIFAREFTLTAGEVSSASITGGQWSIDDSGTLTLNGHLLSTQPDGGWGAFTTFTVPSSDFVAGKNYLVMSDVSDFYLEAGRLEGTLSYTPTSGIPEPATWAMMLVGFGGLGATMRSRRKQTLATA